MIEAYPYKNIFDLNAVIPEKITLIDHLNGFDSDENNSVLRTLDNRAQKLGVTYFVRLHNVLESLVSKQYNNLLITFDAELQDKQNFLEFKKYTTHPELNFKNFVCSFNGSAHVSRKFLVSILQKFGYFNPEYCSKNFSYSLDSLDGIIWDYTNVQHRFYRKFFISDDSEEFFQKIHSFGHVRFDHTNNIYNLENKLTQSFIHIVSETMATSYQPFVTEKFLYSVVTRGLFLSYAQPGWHDHLEKYYGFKQYTKLFDYRFDAIQNPVERLVELMSMLSKFSMLTPHEWHDLYLLEQDTIEYNYNHYFSQDYLTCLEKFR